MKNILLKTCLNLILLCTLIITEGCQKTELVDVLLFERRMVQSTAVGDDYEILIIRPKDYSEQKQYPVLYLLDGDYLLQSDLVPNLAIKIKEVWESGEIPECIIVGIANDAQRTRDYTYPKTERENSGGALKFHQFITTELQQRIASEFSIDDQQQVLMGHSLGGYFVFLSLFQNPESAFTHYVASSPALTYGEGYIFEEEEKFLTNTSDLPLSLYIGMGEEVPGQVGLTNEMYSRLQKRNFTNFRLEKKIYENESHRSVVIPALVDGLRFVLN